MVQDELPEPGRDERESRPSRRSVLGSAVAGLLTPLVGLTAASVEAKGPLTPDYIPIEATPSETPPPPPPEPNPVAGDGLSPVFIRPGEFVWITVKLDAGAPSNNYPIRLTFDREDALEEIERVVRFKQGESEATVRLRSRRIPDLLGELPVEVRASGGVGVTKHAFGEFRLKR